MHKLEELNPGAKFNLLELEQIFELNKLGKEQEFQILNCFRFHLESGGHHLESGAHRTAGTGW